MNKEQLAEEGRLWEPGSDGARASGCKCPAIDNHHGRGRYGDGSRYGWFIVGDCELHASVAGKVGPRWPASRTP